MPLSIAEDYMIAAGQRLLIDNDPIGILLRHPHVVPDQPPPPTLTIHGEYAYRGSGTSFWSTALQFEYSSGGWSNSEIGNQTHVAIRISETGVVDVEGGRFIRGVFSEAYNGDFVNDGRFEVRCTDPFGIADGLGTPHGTSFDFINRGTYRVLSLNEAKGVTLANGGNFVNSGTFEVLGGTSAIGLHTSGGGGATQFLNTGTIRVLTDIAGGEQRTVALQYGHLDDYPNDRPELTFVIRNEGLIESNGWAIKGIHNFSPMQRARDVLLNSGEIIGDIDLFLGNDEIVNTGRIEGDVYLNGDNDIYRGQDGLLIGSVFGGDGHDQIFGGDLDEYLAGDGGDDIIHGGGGDDRLEGGRGRDQLFGEDGDDVLFLFAGPDDDLIDGGAGYDVVELWAKKSDFEIIETSDGILLAGQWGKALLKNIEAISFSDGIWSPGLIVCPPAPEAEGAPKTPEAPLVPVVCELESIDPRDLATTINPTAAGGDWIL